MKRFTTIALVFIALWLSSWQAYAAERYKDTVGGFSYEVPADWKTMEFPGLKFKVLITQPIGKFSPNMTLVDEAYTGTLAEYVTANIPAMEKTIPGFKMLNRSQGKTQDGREYRSVGYTHKVEGGVLMQVASFLQLTPGRMLVMTCTIPRGHEKTIEPVCHRIVTSLQVDS